MRTKHLCVLIHIKNKDEVATVKHFKPSSNYVTDCSKGVLLLWILFVVCVSCLSLSCYLECSLQPCGHLRGNS